jgi:hypothetical protein
MLAKISNGIVIKYPYTIRMLRAEHPNISFPADINKIPLEKYNLVRYRTEPKPSEDHTKVFSKGLVNENGEWIEKWYSRDASSAEIEETNAIKSTEIRNIRNILLSETDWTQGKDIPSNISEPYSIYRQSLRDISTQPGFPWDIQWPEKP